ncbi:MAG: carboxypeptidase regulatory-like domain-containing protein [Hyphomicrobiales bacterium]|nr:carboxypeptidase regulatory-like domain-containing protein [Hyphomicrobiales bacterium]
MHASTRRLMPRLVAGATLALLFLQPVSPASAQASLAGQVTATAEGAMEGVIVSAKKDGSTVTVSVISDAQGRYSFPTGRLEPGRYSLQIRAVGYDLDSPKTTEIAAAQPTVVDIKLRKTRNLSRQLTNAEWMMSIPGSDDDKMQLINCVSCHTLERVVKSTHDADELVHVVARMNGYAQVSQPIKPQRRVDQSRAANPERFRKVAEYLATINLSADSEHEFDLKTMPRVSGRGTKAVITEYDLPRPTIEPHDVIIVDGEAWYTNFGEQFIGKVDPRTGKHTEYSVPELRGGFPNGNLDLGVDRDGKRRALDRRHDHRPRGTARSKERHRGRIPASAQHQHAPHVRRQHDHPTDLLGRQQSRGVDRQSRAARLRDGGPLPAVLAPRCNVRRGYSRISAVVNCFTLCRMRSI